MGLTAATTWYMVTPPSRAKLHSTLHTSNGLVFSESVHTQGLAVNTLMHSSWRLLKTLKIWTASVSCSGTQIQGELLMLSL